ncbi:PilW family protein [Bdellovibrio svalbardensis]|uniref:Type II secretion system GspH family protein n=1 Tax=Bdellovibrio svalbardensis TaxID=2972972 RepID=A0ABT6DGD9_9BACT|nr:type II secretion system protein [Bdellovibrio svalbardensis]MDG0815886.1 type II secretion system GspH family protein [Bdellovibrio svalbardensis]
MKLNQKGFSLSEVLVGVALMSIVGMVAASFFVFSKKAQTEITNEIEDKTDSIIAERMLLKDLKYSEPSFNNVLVKDDKGLAFFAFDSERSSRTLDDMPRMLTLQMAGKKEFSFLIVNDKLGGSLMYTPSAAYNIPYVPKDPNVAAPLNFVSLNKMNNGKNTVKSANAMLWNPGVILMLDTPAMVREMTQFGPNYSRPARSPIFVGVVQGEGETRLAPIALTEFIDKTNPMYPNETIENEDSFLREIPPMGGAAPLVRLKAVSIIKYYIEQDNRTGKVNLWRSMFDGRNFTGGAMIASDIEKIEFSRKDPHDSVIYFNIVRKGK